MNSKLFSRKNMDQSLDWNSTSYDQSLIATPPLCDTQEGFYR